MTAIPSPELPERCALYETYRIETIGPEDEGGSLVRRTFIRATSVDAAKERALRVFSKARRPQTIGPRVEGVRLLNGAGYELFSASARD
jgi:hypothetical protein